MRGVCLRSFHNLSLQTNFVLHSTIHCLPFNSLNQIMRSTNLLLFFLPLCAVAWDSEYVVKYSCYLTEETSGSFEDVPHVGLEVKTDQGQHLFIETMGGWTKVKWPGSTKKSAANGGGPRFKQVFKT